MVVGWKELLIIVVVAVVLSLMVRVLRRL